MELRRSRRLAGMEPVCGEEKQVGFSDVVKGLDSESGSVIPTAVGLVLVVGIFLWSFLAVSRF